MKIRDAPADKGERQTVRHKQEAEIVSLNEDNIYGKSTCLNYALKINMHAIYKCYRDFCTLHVMSTISSG